MPSVPQIPLQEKLEYLNSPIPKGIYRARIIDVEEPKASARKDFIFRLSFVLEIQQEYGPRKVWAFYAGYYNTVGMIWSNRKLWIGTEVDVDIRVKNYDGRIYNDAHIIWPEEALDG